MAPEQITSVATPNGSSYVATSGWRCWQSHAWQYPAYSCRSTGEASRVNGTTKSMLTAPNVANDASRPETRPRGHGNWEHQIDSVCVKKDGEWGGTNGTTSDMHHKTRSLVGGSGLAIHAQHHDGRTWGAPSKCPIQHVEAVNPPCWRGQLETNTRKVSQADLPSRRDCFGRVGLFEIVLYGLVKVQERSRGAVCEHEMLELTAR